MHLLHNMFHFFQALNITTHVLKRNGTFVAKVRIFSDQTKQQFTCTAAGKIDFDSYWNTSLDISQNN